MVFMILAATWLTYKRSRFLEVHKEARFWESISIQFIKARPLYWIFRRISLTWANQSEKCKFSCNCNEKLKAFTENVAYLGIYFYFIHIHFNLKKLNAVCISYSIQPHFWNRGTPLVKLSILYTLPYWYHKASRRNKTCQKGPSQVWLSGTQKENW